MSLEVDHQQSFGHGVECGAHACRDGTGGIQMTQHSGKIDIKHNETNEGDEQNHLGAFVVNDPHPTWAAEGLKAQLHLSPLDFARPDGHQGLRVR